ncbi:hypothetical protein CAEBREN_32732 [Caenorhabditis brenneri]|uniref:DUF38 domain-containing protein n=1 Tax=Caenorhabditis brenneri TaxID=135651 RepID=G0NN76_CAEBE|nr:hypothetical protein CAEBREN_32732 [Caenorhabditis brenneri]
MSVYHSVVVEADDQDCLVSEKEKTMYIIYGSNITTERKRVGTLSKALLIGSFILLLIFLIASFGEYLYEAFGPEAGVLEKIILTGIPCEHVPYDEEGMRSYEKLASMEQWKQAQELDMRYCVYVFPFKFATNFKRFSMEYVTLRANEVVELRDVIFRQTRQLRALYNSFTWTDRCVWFPIRNWKGCSRK